MKKKTLNDLSELKMVFSTDPEAISPQEREPDQPAAGTPYPKQTIRISLDRKHRAGKEVTLLEGFELTALELESMAKKLKTQCGIGGSIDQGLILLQGDQRKKLPPMLQKMGFKKIRVIA
ncbi:MAG: translation initiation factor [Saprospiraceae bacterium]|nr:translation initiation factor [Saprospiraceae bacterium]